MLNDMTLLPELKFVSIQDGNDGEEVDSDN